MPTIRVYYCKGRKKSGTPIVVENDSGCERFGSSFNLSGRLKLSMKYDNASSAAKRHKATTVMEIEATKATLDRLRLY